MQIEKNTYNALLLDIRGEIFKAQQDISRIVNRQKVEMSWNIGKSIEGYLTSNSRAQYGQKVFEQLASDVGLSIRLLYQMSGFYKTYPTLPSDDGVLNWSHYRELITVNDEEKRKSFEILAIEDSLGAGALQKKIVEGKSLEKIEKPKSLSRKLSVTRGSLFNYKITFDERSSQKFVDCGFNIFTEIETQFNPEDGILSSTKKGEKFEFKKSSFSSKQIHTYKAYVDKVVDGDTLRVSLDLGFKVRHKEILRLAKINAPERGTSGGTKATEFVKKVLSKVEFVVIKTNKIDIYGRYVANIFFLEGESDPQKIATNGIYLNQLLIDEGLAEVM